MLCSAVSFNFQLCYWVAADHSARRDYCEFDILYNDWQTASLDL